MPRKLIGSPLYRPVCMIWMLIGLLAVTPTPTPAQHGQRTVQALGPLMVSGMTHPSPPRGWNSYTGYSIAVTEEELIKNIDFLSKHLLRYGYDTVTVDNGWFLSGQGEGI